MNIIKVESQEQWDELPNIFSDFTIIEIYCKEITITSNPHNSSARLFNNSSAVLYNNSSARLFNNSSAELYDNSSAMLYGNSSARLFNNSSARLYSDSSAELYDNSSARLFNNSSAEIFNSSSAMLYGNSSARLFNNSSARIFGPSTKVKAFEDSTVLNQCRGASIEQFDNAAVTDRTEVTTVDFDTWLERGYVVADGIYQKLESTEEDEDKVVYKTGKGFVARLNDSFAHGETRDEALIDLEFKISDRDKSKYESWELNDAKSKPELVLAYRVITGACKLGVRDFLRSKEVPDKLTVNDAIMLTSGSYGSEEFKNFFKGIK